MRTIDTRVRLRFQPVIVMQRAARPKRECLCLAAPPDRFEYYKSAPVAYREMLISYWPTVLVLVRSSTLANNEFLA